MNAQEYYLHMFCGINGDQDQFSGAGRIAIAALMSGYGLTGSTKRDLQARVAWQTTPGCLLGMKELREESYGMRQRPGLQFIAKLLDVKKAARTLNFTLNWNALENPGIPFKIDSYIWPGIARIYWMGRFMFARNVIPTEIMDILKARFDVDYDDSRNADHGNLYSHYVMQFFTENGFFVGRDLPEWKDGTVLPASRVEAEAGRLSRADLFLSLAMAMNCSENSVGFFATSASFPQRLVPQRSFRDLGTIFSTFAIGRPSADRGHRAPQCGSYYDTYTVGTPSVSYMTRSAMPNNPREIVPLLFCDPNMTPQQEAANSHSPWMGTGAVNTHLLSRNIATYVTAMLLFEYHLLMTGEALVPLTLLKSVREQEGWEEDLILAQAPSIYMLSSRNCTVHRLVQFNLERQNRV